ncbi:uncharacterized protein LOC122847620 [Aphidius gifuensis]|uniref:uncharacterized protein LOC122847620 n=1 Tax=Aphidius gifuensis TaxID=684658 RepID=UPI001CDD344C|nr:uncharacterized protein LOC122847620 [Aphidius gifuensis]
MSAKRIYIEKDQQASDVGDKDPKVIINSLDYDSLAKIIMLLPIPERIEMEKVCTKWKEACQLAWYDIKKYKCESSIGRCYDNRLMTQSYLEEILSRCGNYLNKLSLSDVCDSSIMPFVGNHCKNLTSLECKFDVDSLELDADHFVHAFTQLDKLKCFRITVDHHFSNETINLSAIIDSLPEEINEIHLLFKRRPIQKPNIPMTVQRFRSLQKLTLAGLCLDNIILKEIADITTLVHLNIELNIHENFFPFNKLVNLEYIDLTMDIAYNLSTEILNTIFCTCKNLKHVDIPLGPYNVAEIPPKKWINFQNLEYLSICCDIMPDLANTIVEYCKNLSNLRIHSPHHIDITALKRLTELKNLECLMLGPGELHEESIIAILNNCKKLKRLEIPGCIIVPFINGNSFSFPSVLDEFSKLQCLEHLNLGYGRNLNDSTITAIANNCKNLKSLDVPICLRLTETALVAITNLENLEKLDVSYLHIITDSFLIKLKGLKKLNCDSCPNVTDVGIIQFIKNNPDLENIGVSSTANITIDSVIAADQATKNRTNGIILHIRISNPSIIQASKSIITSQWLVVE